MSKARFNNLSDLLNDISIPVHEIRDAVALADTNSVRITDLENATDPFPQYYNQERGDGRYVRVTTLAQPNGVATLDSGGKITFDQIPDAALGGLSYQGSWDANTNTPTLFSGQGTRGYFYKVNVAGNTDLDGLVDWKIGDWVIFDGAAWQKIDQTEIIQSVNGYTGDVNLDTDDIPEGTLNLYYTDTRASNAAPVQTVHGRAGNVVATDGDYSASQTVFNPATSDLLGTRVQGVIEEVNTKLNAHINDTGDPYPQYTTPTEAANAAPVQSVNGKTDNVVLSTTDVGEGTNLYHTTARARASISVGGDLSYDSVAGVISFSETYSTPTELLTAVKTVDGSTSGLDADLLDGQHGAYYLDYNNFTNLPTYDNYGSWTLYTDGTNRGGITSGEVVNFIGGTNVTLSYSATNNGITINATDTNTTYTAGTGLSLSGTQFNVDNPFDPAGTYASLRAQATTKADVGLSGIPNTNASTVNFLRGDGAWVTPPDTNTTYSAGNGISLSGTTFSVAGGDGLTQEASGLAVDSTVVRDSDIGTNAERDVLIQTSEPTSGQGADGDICYVYTP